MASTEKRVTKKGRTRYRGIYHDAHGKKHHTPYVDREKDARADAVEAQAEAQRTAGTTPTRGNTTWGDWFKVWWAARDIEPATEKSEMRYINSRILPQWGYTELARITQPEVQQWVTWLHRRGGLSGESTCRVYTIFQSSMTAAVERGVLGASPCVGVKRPPRSKGRQRRYTTEELNAACAELRPKGWTFAVRFIVETGLRPDEFAGLHRWRIDRESGWLTVREVYDFVAKRIKSYPKDEDERDIPLTSRALELLAEWETNHPPRPTCGETHQHGRCRGDLLYRQPNGRPLQVSSFESAWRNAQVKAGVTPLDAPYALRHTMISNWLDAGVDVLEVARIVGHGDVKQTQGYAHRSAAARQRVLGILGDPAARLRVVEGGAHESARQRGEAS